MSARRLLLIGWDGADWRFTNPLLDAGLMPALEGLIERGVIGNLASIRPLLSPLIWTSIATGKLPDKHGILGFIEPDPVSGGVRPASSQSRKVKAVWNILTQQGLRTHVVAWMATHPAEPIRGIAVSPLFQRATAPHRQPWPLPSGSIHPDHLSETFTALRVHPGEFGEEEILPFIPRAAEIDQDRDKRLAGFAIILAECVSVHNAITWILEHEDWDFAAVYYDALDHFSHAFAAYHSPAMEGVPERDREINRDVLAGAYRFHDMMLARLLELAGPEATVMLVSDHGFHSGRLLPRRIPREPAGPAVAHRPVGIFCLAGPGIRRDERIYGASVLDITPTVLALFGLPVGRDMDGKVLLQAFEKPPRLETIPSWDEVPGEAGMHAADQRMDPVAAQALIQQFVALGYIEPPSPERSQAVATAVRESQFNLAQVYQYTQRPRLARPLLEELVRDHPGESRYAVPLAQCLLSLGERERARQLLQSLLESEERRPWAEWLMAMTDLLEERADEALERLIRLEQDESRLPALYVRLGSAYLRLGRLEDAERAFKKALELDADLPAAYLGLCRVGLRQKRYEEAAEAALEAVGLEHFLPAGHYLLGVALARLGRYQRAIQAFELALSMQPGLAGAHRWLAALYGRPGGDPGKAVQHRLRYDQLLRERQGSAQA